TEITKHVGLTGLGPGNETEMPSIASRIADAHTEASRALVDTIRNDWSDATLQVIDDVYGYRWPRSRTMGILLTHEIHHRGQLTAMLRIGGAKVPGVYGPSSDSAWEDG
ncbi:MAG: DinB family protein, partial [Gemmatimonadota bacterium]|nr:DinB family protein [Gemmatimonadota bacterium]